MTTIGGIRRHQSSLGQVLHGFARCTGGEAVMVSTMSSTIVGYPVQLFGLVGSESFTGSPSM